MYFHGEIHLIIRFPNKKRAIPEFVRKKERAKFPCLYRDKVYFMEEIKMEKEISNTFVSKSRFELNTIIIKIMILFENCFSFILLRFRIILQCNIFIRDGRTHFKTREHLSLLFSGIYSMKCLAVSLIVRSNDLRPGCAGPSLNSPSSHLTISCWNLKWSIFF
jgi:hypothetical protein